jgi:anti-sigma factor ChrR (cupin superfamily)
MTPHSRCCVEASTLEDQARWRQLRDGVPICFPHEEPNEGRRIAWLKYSPGACVSRHRHSGDEHESVLEGSQRDENGECARGSYLYNRRGSEHGVCSDDGCLVRLGWMEPIEFR